MFSRFNKELNTFGLQGDIFCRNYAFCSFSLDLSAHVLYIFPYKSAPSISYFHPLPPLRCCAHMTCDRRDTTEALNTPMFMVAHWSLSFVTGTIRFHTSSFCQAENVCLKTRKLFREFMRLHFSPWTPVQQRQQPHHAMSHPEGLALCLQPPTMLHCKSHTF